MGLPTGMLAALTAARRCQPKGQCRLACVCAYTSCAPHPPATCLSARDRQGRQICIFGILQVKDTLKPPYQIAAQNSWVKGVGAYTGEIAPELLKVGTSSGTHFSV